MLKIKLTRLGKKKAPRYRIVVNEARDKRDGQYVALLGNYQPAEQPKVLNLDIKAYEEWLKKGAEPTETVAWLYEQAKTGKGLPDKKKPKLSKKVKAKMAAEAEEKAAAEEAKKAEAIAAKEAEKAAEATEVTETEGSEKTEETTEAKA